MSYNVSRTNRVDVLGDDDLFRIGRVVDVAENGLFIDFLCPSRRRELTPFNRVFLIEDSESSENRLAKAYVYTKPGETVPVDVLMPETDIGPWVWFPGEIVNVARSTRSEARVIAVVYWVNDVACTDLVPVERLRWRVRSDWWATVGRKAPVYPSSSNKGNDRSSNFNVRDVRPQPIDAATFQKRTVLLPKECRDADVYKLLQRVNERVGRYAEYKYECLYSYVSFVDMVEGRVSYVWRRPGIWVHPSEGAFENASSDPTLVQDIFGKWEKALASVMRDTTRMLAKESAVAMEREESANIGLLTVDVLREVFSQLDTTTQTGLRNVCFAWTSILESPALTACLIVNGFEIFEEEEAFDATRHELQYSVTAPLFKCFRPSTQHIVVDARGNWMKNGDFLMMVETMHYVGQKTGSRVRTIHFVGFSLSLQIGDHGDSDDDDDNDDHADEEDPEDDKEYNDKCHMHRNNADKTNDCCYCLVDFVAACGDLPCDAVQLVDCALVLEFARLDEVQVLVRVAAARLALGGDVGGAVWAALEQYVPMPSKKQLDMLARWLASVRTAEDNTSLIGFIRSSHARIKRELTCKALCATQSADPRPSLHYHGKQWCVDGLQGLQLEKLSSVALQLLVNLAEHFKRSSTLDGDSDDGSDVQPMDDESD